MKYFGKMWEASDRENTQGSQNESGHADGVVMSMEDRKQLLDNCRICSLKYVTHMGRLSHVAQDHMELCAIQCQVCEFTSPWNIWCVERHIQKEHPIQLASHNGNCSELIKDHRSEYSEIIQWWLAHCFGPSDPGPPPEKLYKKLEVKIPAEEEGVGVGLFRDCQKCGTISKQSSIPTQHRFIHIAEAHLGIYAIRCMYCYYHESWSPLKLADHVMKKHPDVVRKKTQLIAGVDFRDSREEYSPMMIDFLSECFNMNESQAARLIAQQAGMNGVLPLTKDHRLPSSPKKRQDSQMAPLELLMETLTKNANSSNE